VLNAVCWGSADGAWLRVRYLALGFVTRRNGRRRGGPGRRWPTAAGSPVARGRCVIAAPARRRR